MRRGRGTWRRTRGSEARFERAGRRGRRGGGGAGGAESVGVAGAVLGDRGSRADERALDAEGLNAAVAEQLRNTSKRREKRDDARSDRSDVSWSRKPGGAERQAAAEAEAAELEAAAQRSRAERWRGGERGQSGGGKSRSNRREGARATRRRRGTSTIRRHDAVFRRESVRGSVVVTGRRAPWRIFSRSVFATMNSRSRPPHVMVAHRREDDAWRVVGPYAARDRVENYGRVVNGAVVSLDKRMEKSAPPPIVNSKSRPGSKP